MKDVLIPKFKRGDKVTFVVALGKFPIGTNAEIQEDSREGFAGVVGLNFGAVIWTPESFIKLTKDTKVAEENKASDGPFYPHWNGVPVTTSEQLMEIYGKGHDDGWDNVEPLKEPPVPVAVANPEPKADDVPQDEKNRADGLSTLDTIRREKIDWELVKYASDNGCHEAKAAITAYCKAVRAIVEGK